MITRWVQDRSIDTEKASHWLKDAAAHAPRAGRKLGRVVETPRGLKRAIRSLEADGIAGRIPANSGVDPARSMLPKPDCQECTVTTLTATRSVGPAANMPSLSTFQADSVHRHRVSDL